MMDLIGNKGREPCEHSTASATTYSGLVREVCEECGDLSIRPVGQGDTGILFQAREPSHSLMAIHGPDDIEELIDALPRTSGRAGESADQQR